MKHRGTTIHVTDSVIVTKGTFAALAILLMLWVGVPMGCSKKPTSNSSRSQPNVSHDSAWLAAQQKNSLAGYTEYCKANPTGSHVTDAVKRIHELSIDEVIQRVLTTTSATQPAHAKTQPNWLASGYMATNQRTEKATRVDIKSLVTDGSATKPPFDASSAKQLRGMALKAAEGVSIASYNPKEQESVLWVLAQAAMVAGGQGNFVIHGFKCLKPHPTSGPRLLSKSYLAGTGSHITRTVPQKRALLGGLTISEGPDGAYLLQTVLPNERLYTGWGKGGLMGPMITVLPAAPGSIYRFEGKVSGFIPGYTLEADKGETLAFVVTEFGLCHIAGRGRAIAADGTQTQLPIKKLMTHHSSSP